MIGAVAVVEAALAEHYRAQILVSVADPAVLRPCESPKRTKYSLGFTKEKPMATAVKGVRFSLNYLSHPELLPDSKRMRRRLGLLFFQYCQGNTLRSIINRELARIDHSVVRF